MSNTPENSSVVQTSATPPNLASAFQSPLAFESIKTGKVIENNSGDEIVVSVYTIAILGGAISVVSMAIGIFLSSFAVRLSAAPR